jgi:hypothetical protein
MADKSTPSNPDESPNRHSKGLQINSLTTLKRESGIESMALKSASARIWRRL